MSEGGARPERIVLRWTLAGRTALLLALCGLACSVPFGSSLALLPLLLLVAFCASAPLAWWPLRSLHVSTPAARTAHAGARIEFPLAIRSSGCLLTARDLVVYAGADGPASSRPLAHLDVAAAGDARPTACEWRTRRRGAIERLDLRLTSTFPLGWWEARAHVAVAVDWLSLPRLARLDEHVAPPPRWRRDRAHVSSARRGDEEFYALRDARPGDSPHWIHWRSSARRGKTVVRELRGEEQPEACVVLLGWVAQAPAPGRLHDSFEQAVSLTAALVERNARRGETTRVRFEGANPWSVRVPPTRAAVQSLLARLALIDCSPDAASTQAVLSALERARGEGAHVVHALGELDRSWRVVQRVGRSTASVVVGRPTSRAGAGGRRPR